MSPARDSRMEGVGRQLLWGTRTRTTGLKMIAAETVKANCSRETRSAVISIVFGFLRQSSAADVTAMVVKQPTAVPVGAPVAPSPAKPGKQPDTDAQPERIPRPVKIPSRIRVPIWIDPAGGAVDNPGIVFRDGNDVGIRRLNDHRRSLGRHGFLRSVLQGPGIFGASAHYLDRIHHSPRLACVGISDALKSRQGCCPCFAEQMETA
jgi:hypothetical protein